MKKFFTYLFASAAFCMIGTVNAMAQDVEEEDLLPDMFYDWTDPENPKEFEVEYKVGDVADPGNVIIGTGALFFNVYADLSDWDELEMITDGQFARVFMNRYPDENGGHQAQCSEEYDPNTLALDGNKAWVQERYYTISEDRTVYTVNLKKICDEFGFAHLNGIKNGWGGQVTYDSIILRRGGATGIETATLKEVLNAQQYNLAGQKVNNNAKGLVIMNGKKYVK